MRKWIVALGALALMGCSSWSKQEDENKSQYYLQMATAHLESGNYPFALRDLQSAEKLNPKNPVIQNNLGLVYFMRERFDLSEVHFKKALDLQQEYSDARNNLARLYIEVGRYKEAEKEIKMVLDDLTYANVGKAYINLGLAKFNQKQYEAALRSFEKVLESQSDNCVANTYRGRSIFEMKDYARAAEALDRAIGFCQKELYDEPHYYSALAYYRLGDKSKAIARFEELIKYYPTGKYRNKAKGMLDLIRKGH
ncbi:lipoprotein NlpI [compost metagenome]